MTDIMMMTSELPMSAVKRVLQLTRKHRIAGTNKYARVCRQWREASRSDDWEPLHLFLDMTDMSDDELASAMSWASMHGYQLDKLTVHAWGLSPERLQLLCQPAAAGALTCLRRLEVEHAHSLSLLAPVLGQLPHLQHLTASVGMVVPPSQEGDVWSDQEGDMWSGQEGDMWSDQDGVLMDHHEVVWEEVPHLQQLCPQLASLHLNLWVKHGSGDLWVDTRLSLLLPAHLQQLVLEDVSCEVACMVVLSSSLQHLTALRELDLLKVGVAGLGSGTLPHPQQLQQLRVCEPHMGFRFCDPLELGPKVTEYSMSKWSHADKIPLTQHLTQLFVYSKDDMPGEVLDAAAAQHLQGLQVLRYRGYCGTNTAACLQMTAGLASLRRFDLQLCADSSAAVGSALACCTQLTTLSLSLVYMHEGRPDEGPLVSGLQQLTGLGFLKVTASLLEQQAGAWLAPLTALTCVEVIWLDRTQAAAELEGVTSATGGGEQPWAVSVARLLLQCWHVWPQSLRQVVFWAAPFLHGSKPPAQRKAWVHTPTSPGAAQVNVWLEEAGRAAKGWPRPFRACPHLPGVWELPAKVEQSSE